MVADPPGVAATRYPRGMPFGVSWWELLILLLFILLIFGPKRLPEMGRQLGKGMREFKDSVTGKVQDEPEELPAASGEDEVAAPAPRERDTVS